MLVEYTARTYTRIQIVQYTTTRFFSQNDESNSVAMNTAKKCGCKKFVKICGCKMGHDPRKLGKLSVDRYSDIQTRNILLVNLVEERLEIDLGSAIKKDQAGLFLILGLQQIFHPDVLCSNLTRDAEHR